MRSLGTSSFIARRWHIVSSSINMIDLDSHSPHLHDIFASRAHHHQSLTDARDRSQILPGFDRVQNQFRKLDPGQVGPVFGTQAKLSKPHGPVRLEFIQIIHIHPILGNRWIHFQKVL